MQVITQAIDSGDGVFIERGRPSTASKQMPAFVKLGDIKASSANHLVVQPESFILSTESMATNYSKFADALTNQGIPCYTEFLNPSEGEVVRDPLNVRNPMENATSETMATNYGSITGVAGDNLLGYPGAGSEQLTTSALPVNTYCTGYCFDGGADLGSENRFIFEPIEAMTSFGDSPVLKEPSNLDVICDVGTSMNDVVPQHWLANNG